MGVKMRDMRQPDLLLLGCVSKKSRTARKAKDLYDSQLFRSRRGYAEATDRPWLILSALHGVVDPEAVLEPYDLALESLPDSERQAWGEEAARAIENRVGSLAERVIEVHAGAAYVDAVRPALERRGCTVSIPLKGLRLGEQLHWYAVRRR